MFKNTLILIFVSTILSACVNPQHAKYAANNNRINFIPMYGSPDIKKTESQKLADKKFIKTVIKNSGSRKKAATEFSAWGWSEKRKGNVKNSISRFNQSWLIDPNYYQPYWGFGAVALVEKNPKKAAMFFEKALSLIDEEKEKPRLQVDTARAYAWQASKIKKTDSIISEKLYKKANKLIDKALNLDPKYRKAYSMGGIISYDQGNFKRAWEIVKKSRDSDSYKFDSKFIEKLSKLMPEP